MGLAKKIADYKAPKIALFWTAFGASVTTAVIGFNVLGWTTADTAAKAAKDAVAELRVEFASQACLENFLAADDAATIKGELAGLNAYKAQKQILALDWVSKEIATSSNMEHKAAKACWKLVMQAELPEPVAEPEIEAPEVVVVPAVIEPEISEPEVLVVPGKGKPAPKVDVKPQVVLPEVTLPEVVVEPAAK
jgi:hypothetical protein